MKNILNLVFIVFLLIDFGVGMTQEVIKLENKRELFVDHYLIDSMNNVNIELKTPKEEENVLFFDKPWEGAFSGFITILKDGDLFRMYYRGLPEVIEGDIMKTNNVTCYAESKDGIHWRKPDLGIYTIHGTRKNNVVLANANTSNSNFSPFIDTNPEILPDQKYKAVGGLYTEGGLYVFTSPDGIHWSKLKEEPVFTEGRFDTQNVVFWSESEKKYVCYFRIYPGYRTVSRTTSPDFIHWSDPVQMDFGDTPNEEIYIQQTSPYYRAPHIYVAIGARFMPERQVLTDEQALELQIEKPFYSDCSDVVFMTSRGGNKYDRTFMESFIRPEIGLKNWISRTNYPALNVVQTSETEMSVYVNKHYTRPTAHLTRYSMRIDGFTSLSSGYNGGKVVTKPLTFSGKELEINYSTSAAGSIKVEFQDINGEAIQGYSLEDCVEIIGNEIQRIVHWKGGKDLSELSEKPVRLQIYLKDADLYSIKFND